LNQDPRSGALLPVTISAATKRKPGGGNAGSDVIFIGVYGLKYAAWLSFAALWRGESISFSFSANILFLFFYFLVLLSTAQI
jgi:hypothetical protein